MELGGFTDHRHLGFGHHFGDEFEGPFDAEGGFKTENGVTAECDLFKETFFAPIPGMIDKIEFKKLVYLSKSIMTPF